MNCRLIGMMLALSWLGFPAVSWSAEAGRVQFVQGAVQASDAAGRARTLQKGDVVNEGDTLVTAAGASAQLRMADGGFIAVRPETRMKIESFRFGGKAEEPESSFLSLFKGGFRAVTGLIGRMRKEDYRIKTPAATIGIRGTDHETVVVAPDSSLASAGVSAGTYNKVNAGETTITTDKGTLNVLPNQMGYAGGMNQAPKQMPVNANLFAAAPPPPADAKVAQDGQEGEAPRETAVVDNTAQQATATTDTAATTDTTAGTASVMTAVAPPTVVTTLAQNVVTIPTPAAGAIGFYFTNANGTWTTGGGGIVETLPTATGGLGGFKIISSFGACTVNCLYTISFQSGSIGTATLLEQGSNAAAGNIHWGRWFGQGATIAGLPAGTALLNSNLIYVGGSVPTMPLSGTAVYLPVGGTSPVDAAGNTGKFIGANISVDFGLSSIAVANMQVAFGGDTFTMAGSGTFLANGSIPSVPISGACTGTCAMGTAMNGDIAGSFTGTNAAGLALGYHISTGVVTAGGAPAFEIMGAQAFAKQ